MTLNFWSSRIHLLNARITGLCHNVQFILCLEKGLLGTIWATFPRPEFNVLILGDWNTVKVKIIDFGANGSKSQTFWYESHVWGMIAYAFNSNTWGAGQADLSLRAGRASQWDPVEGKGNKKIMLLSMWHLISKDRKIRRSGLPGLLKGWSKNHCRIQKKFQSSYSWLCNLQRGWNPSTCMVYTLR